ncbi:MAG: hypothetical protein QF410_15595 [Planctomycetota bacterium]|nr:hypothetical protein [Planctomycetota bacterium]MDP6540969.1 hypothetical protein [Planctomycetota bacterium]
MEPLFTALRAEEPAQGETPSGLVRALAWAAAALLLCLALWWGC